MVTSASGPVRGATVTATHAGGTGCPSGVTLTSATPTDANGRLLLALPYGTWTVTATGGSGSASSPATLVDPVSPSIPTHHAGAAVNLCRRLHRDQAGVTTMEMIVVVALLSLVLAVAFEGLTSYQDATAGSAARLRNLEEARVTMAVLTKDLRTATSFGALAAADVTFLGHLNTTATGPPNQVRLYVDVQGRLLEAVTQPDNPTASPITYTGTPVTRVVGRGPGQRRVAARLPRRRRQPHHRRRRRRQRGRHPLGRPAGAGRRAGDRAHQPGVPAQYRGGRAMTGRRRRGARTGWP